jgi:hypothetical protein
VRETVLFAPLFIKNELLGKTCSGQT